VIAISSNNPVASFRYLEINGIVEPSSSSLAVAATCCSRIPNSLAILAMRFEEVDLASVICEHIFSNIKTVKR